MVSDTDNAEHGASRGPDGRLLPGHGVGVEHRFQPGESGNPKGRPPERPITEAIRARLSDDDAIRKLADVVVEKALAGNYRFVRELLDRIDGVLGHAEATLVLPPMLNIFVTHSSRRLDKSTKVSYHPSLPALGGEVSDVDADDAAGADR